ncbi:MAG: hypothetical protein KGJ09_03515 [Candidatus Omnitrophica bacterium]|nr:hypothetical protein [Candidatus Omnitrophota bacterium]MDE2009127.1 hypothetical protein [Candidatus Omnitrophota bacterium]MDE2214208.1 hypothetical protein [Candidatus Omnitrophota bacterium]MDE2231245.1 hypothetical protein [Candidatus Omnitrophota bacterium]
MFENLNIRLRRLDVGDIGLVKWACVVFGIVLAKFFPQLLQINYIVLVALMLVFSVRPTYKFWIKKAA